ncbi:hypothetical protein QFZ77_007635 [Paenibacillus sp. V4I3]|uniref:AIPR family protein n=1 Tax=Paenibacillus sp. V4I3 TaxID=3042305 RepID=UPI0027896E6C|nr:AIPR family protein [Paenibacillus sp. V4I3]MDQ0878976.1 hypothetical protein [Paenibacillus sp. V4I3]
MDNSLQDFAQGLKQHLEGLAAAKNEEYSVKTFVENIAGYLEEAEELDTVDVCDFQRPGIQLNGYAINEVGNSIAIDLIVCLHTKIVPPLSIHKNEWDSVIKRAIGFIKKSFTGLHLANDQVYDIAKKIYDSKELISQIRVFFFTDGITKTIQLEDVEVEGIPVSFQVWDIERIYRMRSSGRKKEPILIDLEGKYGNPLPCLPMPVANDHYDSYMLIVPGILLSQIYHDFGERLIERNVRSFLQVRGVNREIKKTITKEPYMFLAYNNGISATAEQIEFFPSTDGVKVIKSIRDLQIVNGGQTTASIYHAAQKDKDVDISQVFVQMKLTVIKDPEKMEEMVPTISFCANSQNKIQTADFYSNSPFHRKLEHLSRTEWAPAKEGSHRQSKWFYERARGQYLDMKNKHITPAKKRLFEEDHPKGKLFTKTDLAKYIISWEQLPHIVSRGNQKNFDYFSKTIKDIDVEQIDKNYYYKTIAKAIIFNTISEMIKTKNRANIVTYSMAWLSYKMQEQIDLEDIWKNQAVPSILMDTIKLVINAAHNHITNSPNGEIYSEWSKREECWTTFRDMSIEEFLRL